MRRMSTAIFLVLLAVLLLALVGSGITPAGAQGAMDPTTLAATISSDSMGGLSGKISAALGQPIPGYPAYCAVGIVDTSLFVMYYGQAATPATYWAIVVYTVVPCIAETQK